MIIHQIFFEMGNGTLEDIPRFKFCYHYNKTICNTTSNIDYKLWFREEIEIFILNYSLQFPEKAGEWYTFYKNLRYDIQRIDFARLIIIYVFGGIYLDLDVEINNASPKLMTNFIGLFEKPLLISRWDNSHLPYNAVIGCHRENEFILRLIRYIILQYDSKKRLDIYKKWRGRFVFQTTGHHAIHRCFKSIKEIEYVPCLYVESKGKLIGDSETAIFHDTNESFWFKDICL